MKTTRPALTNAMFRMSSDVSDQAPRADPARGGVIGVPTKSPDFVG